VVLGAEGPIAIDCHSLHYYSDGAAGGRKEERLHSCSEPFAVHLSQSSSLLRKREETSVKWSKKYISSLFKKFNFKRTEMSQSQTNKLKAGRVVSFHQSIIALGKKSLRAFISAPREVGTTDTKPTASPSTPPTVYSDITAPI
jgi:hypothetical protein